jgi:hypothetical protein
VTVGETLLEAEPLTGAAMTGALGATVSMDSEELLDGELVLPAASVAVAVTVRVPSVIALDGV